MKNRLTQQMRPHTCFGNALVAIGCLLIVLSAPARAVQISQGILYSPGPFIE